MGTAYSSLIHLRFPSPLNSKHLKISSQVLQPKEMALFPLYSTYSRHMSINISSALGFLLFFLVLAFDPSFTLVAAPSGISPVLHPLFFQSSWPLSFSFYGQYFSPDNLPPTLCHYFIFTFVVHDVPPQVMSNFRNAVSSCVLYKDGN